MAFPDHFHFIRLVTYMCSHVAMQLIRTITVAQLWFCRHVSKSTCQYHMCYVVLHWSSFLSQWFNAGALHTHSFCCIPTSLISRCLLFSPLFASLPLVATPLPVSSAAVISGRQALEESEGDWKGKLWGDVLHSGHWEQCLAGHEGGAAMACMCMYVACVLYLYLFVWYV